MHFFNSFFYPKLLKTGYSGVRRWTKKVNLKFIKYLKCLERCLIYSETSVVDLSSLFLEI